MSRPASLDVVEDTVRREFDAQERRADAADTRAGLILGFAGLVVSLGGDGWPPLALTARFLACSAALSSLAALSVRRFHGLDISALRQYVAAQPAVTRQVLLKARIEAHDEAALLLRLRLARLRLASHLLAAALACAICAATVEVIA